MSPVKVTLTPSKEGEGEAEPTEEILTLKTEEEKCKVEKRTVCERVTRKSCSMIDLKNCSEVSERMLSFTV